MAGISPNLPDDTRSRTLTVVLLPDVNGLAEDSDWEEIEEEAQALADKVAAWARVARIDLPKPPLPAEVRGRAKERGRPLWRVAHAAGGHWPARCLELIATETEELAAEREDGVVKDHPAITLLRDVAAEWPPGLDIWASDAMRTALVTRQPDRWGPSITYPKGLTTQRIGRYLGRNFRMWTLRASDGSRLGYAARDLAAVCSRLGITFAPVTVGSVGGVETGAATQRGCEWPPGSSGCSCPAGHHDV